MANEIRVRANFTGGLIDDSPLTIAATTFTSNALQALQVIGATQHMAVVLDPDGYGGAPEIAYLTGHTSAASTATLLRGQEGTAARAHIQDTPWVHSATAVDFVPVQLAAVASYQPAADYTITSATQADVDATNLKITFTAPVSTKVMVIVEVYAYNSGGETQLGLRESTTNVAGPRRVSSGANAQRTRTAFPLTVTAGAHTLKLAASNSGGTTTIYAASGSNAPIQMEVYENYLG